MTVETAICRFCGFVPRSGSTSNLLKIDERPDSVGPRKYACINKGACDARKARKHG